MSQKIAYVTGGMGGIGTCICHRLHRDGFKVIAGCGPSRDHAKWLAEQKALGYTFYASVGNVADWDSTVEAFKHAKEEHGVIDVLVKKALAEGRTVLERVVDRLVRGQRAERVIDGPGDEVRVVAVDGRHGDAPCDRGRPDLGVEDEP